MVGMRKLPSNQAVIYCKKCVISNQRPRIEFDADGVCNACNFALKKHSQIRWEDREKELISLLDQHRSHDGRFDVVIPCSGGKDSTRVAHLLKYRYNMHPLSVTWAPHIYTEIGWTNLQAMIHSGFDNVLVTPNGKVHRIMTRLAFELIGDPFQPFIYGQMAQPFQVACKYKIPLVFYGENGEAEYGGLKSDEDLSGPPMETFAKRYFSGVMADVFTDYGISKTDLQLYRMPSVENIMVSVEDDTWDSSISFTYTFSVT
jgi:N-acetyl sugar amidotransferase